MGHKERGAVTKQNTIWKTTHLYVDTVIYVMDITLLQGSEMN